jgi:hypothetical protein
MNDTISNNINNLMKEQSNSEQSKSMQGQNNPDSSGDLQQQDIINQTLISAGLPQNKLNDLIEMTRDKLMCDPACQKQRQADAYKQKWELAKKNYKAAPEEIKQAEKNYYIFDKGYAAYKDMLYDRYAKTAAEFKLSSNKKHATVQSDLQAQLDNYTAGTIYLKRMNELLQIKLKEKEELNHKIDAYIGFTETNGRKVIYEDRERNILTTYRQGIIYLFYAFIILYIVFGSFIPQQAYKQWKVWLILALFYVFPRYIVDRQVILMYAIYNYLKSWRLPKNVYKNL